MSLPLYAEPTALVWSRRIGGVTPTPRSDSLLWYAQLWAVRVPEWTEQHHAVVAWAVKAAGPGGAQPDGRTDRPTDGRSSQDGASDAGPAQPHSKNLRNRSLPAGEGGASSRDSPLCARSHASSPTRPRRGAPGRRP